MMSGSDERIIEFAKNPSSGPKIAVIGGGTGLSTMLRGLKLFTENITAVVTVADNGGSSGMLREDLGMLPPGDIRNCILALADVEPLMSDLLNYRFKEGRLRGQNFGNLLIAAMDAISGNFAEAVRNVSNVLAVKGVVLPVSLQDIQIGARLRDGTIILGESEIGNRQAAPDNPIEEIFMQPAEASAMPEAVEALRNADAIIIGPGSLYTSLIPNLLFPEIREAVASARVPKIYVCNLMTQSAETLDFDALHHLRAILSHAGRKDAVGFIDYCVVNTGWIDSALIARYRLESAIPVQTEPGSLEQLGAAVIREPLACVSNGVIRHDHTVLARAILRIMLERPDRSA